ncbi:MAG: undecaprenyl-diphosphate phosphatase [Verrucomicrobia bacterium]|nr:undecaprenyl-diphosphate phosphatase [Verrucomicrobiota bacterium]
MKNTTSQIVARCLLTLLGAALFVTLSFAQSEPGEEIFEPAELGFVESTVLGFVEGLTEYLPISSTGHLILTAHFLDLSKETVLQDEAGNTLYLETPSKENPGGTPLTLKAAIDAYLIIIQLGAIAAVVIVYWNRLLSIIYGLLGKDPKGLLLLRNLILAFIPAVVVGLLLEDVIEDYLFGNEPVILALFVGGLGILVVDRWHNKYGKDDSSPELHELTPLQCLFIGGMQCVAMWPGTSRSMMTIIGGYLVRLSPTKAAEFSFLLGLVTLSAASVYKGYKVGLPLIDAFGWWMPILGCLVAAISATLAVKWMVGYLGKHGLAVFGYYRIVLALVLAWVFYY